jgi:hypothetical protein
MKYLTITCWASGPLINHFIKKIQNETEPFEVILLFYYEYELVFINSRGAFKHILNLAETKNFKVHIITGNSKLHPFPSEHLLIHKWPSFFITYFNYHKVTEISYNISKLFCLLNGKRHAHRYITMDILSKSNLLEYGHVSWNSRLPKTCPYKPSHWVEEDLVLDDFNSNWCLIPPQLSECFMNIVSETNTTTYFLTEKTAKPLLLKQPFLVVGAVGFHTTFLKSLGFKLYDEIFNYDFDLVDNDSTRIQMLIDQVSRYKNYTNLELENLRSSILDKIDYNYNLAVDLAVDLKHWPTKLVDILKTTNVEDTVLMSIFKKLNETA